MIRHCFLLAAHLVGLLRGVLVVVQVGTEALLLGTALSVNSVGGRVTMVRYHLLVFRTASLGCSAGNLQKMKLG